MQTRLDISVDEVTPSLEAVLEVQRVPAQSTSDRTRGLIRDALSTFRALGAPVALMADVAREGLMPVYEGAGQNSVPGALDSILATMDQAALFAGTVGQSVSLEIARLFERNDFAAGSMLDTAASLAADRVADVTENRWSSELRRAGRLDRTRDVMRFSPGYCGWHVSGQKRLFDHLRPEQIGITLSESCLMQPLKSVSGVVIVSPWTAFDIDDTFPFCGTCPTHSCRDRFEVIRRRHTP